MERWWYALVAVWVTLAVAASVAVSTLGYALYEWLQRH